MSNGNLDNSAPLVGVLKLQTTQPKQRGLQPKWTSPRTVITAISRPTSQPRNPSQGREMHTQPGPWGPQYTLWPALSEGLRIPGRVTHAMIKDTRREKRAEQTRLGVLSSQKAWRQSRTNESAQVTPSDTPGVSFPRRGLTQWNYSLSGEGSTNWELLIFQVCQAYVNNHQDHRYLRLALGLCSWRSCHSHDTAVSWWVTVDEKFNTKYTSSIFLPDAQALGLHGSSRDVWELQRLGHWKWS